MKITRVAAALAATVALSGVAASAAAPSLAAVSGVVVTVSCHANPEKVTIRNDRNGSITILRVGSTYQPRAGEPYSVNRTLGAGKSITYSFGTRRGPNKLTNQFIFADHPRENAKVVTGLGTIKRSC